MCMNYSAMPSPTPGIDPDTDEPHETCVKNCSVWWMFTRLMAFVLVWIMLSMYTSTFLGHIPRIVQELIRFEGNSSAPVLFGKSQSFKDATTETQDTTELGSGAYNEGGKKGRRKLFDASPGLGTRSTSGRNGESAIYSSGFADAFGLAGSVFRGVVNDSKKIAKPFKKTKKDKENKEHDKQKGDKEEDNTEHLLAERQQSAYYQEKINKKKEKEEKILEKKLQKDLEDQNSKRYNMVFQNRNTQEKSIGRKAIENPAIQYVAGATKNLAKDLVNDGVGGAAEKRFNARYKRKTKAEKTAEREAILLKASSSRSRDQDGNKVVITRNKRTGEKTRYAVKKIEIKEKVKETNEDGKVEIVERVKEVKYKIVSKKTFSSKENYEKKRNRRDQNKYAKKAQNQKDDMMAGKPITSGNAQDKNFFSKDLSKTINNNKDSARKYFKEPLVAAAAGAKAAAGVTVAIGKHGDKQARINRNLAKSKERNNVTLQKVQLQASKMSTDKDGNKVVITRNKRTGEKTKYVFDKNNDKLLKKSVFTSKMENDEARIQRNLEKSNNKKKVINNGKENERNSKGNNQEALNKHKENNPRETSEKNQYEAAKERLRNNEGKTKEPPKPFKLKGNSKAAKRQREMAEKIEKETNKRYKEKRAKDLGFADVKTMDKAIKELEAERAQMKKEQTKSDKTIPENPNNIPPVKRHQSVAESFGTDLSEYGAKDKGITAEEELKKNLIEKEVEQSKEYFDKKMEKKEEEDKEFERKMKNEQEKQINDEFLEHVQEKYIREENEAEHDKDKGKSKDKDRGGYGDD